MTSTTHTGALQLFGELATFHPVVVQRNLPEMILKLIEMSSDVKKEVRRCEISIEGFRNEFYNFYVGFRNELSFHEFKLI